MKPCPGCDLDNSSDSLFCFAVGVALGHVLADIHDVTEHMCSRHRTPYVMAMLKVSKTMRELNASSLSEGKEK